MFAVVDLIRELSEVGEALDCAYAQCCDRRCAPPTHVNLLSAFATHGFTISSASQLLAQIACPMPHHSPRRDSKFPGLKVAPIEFWFPAEHCLGFANVKDSGIRIPPRVRHSLTADTLHRWILGHPVLEWSRRCAWRQEKTPQSAHWHRIQIQRKRRRHRRAPRPGWRCERRTEFALHLIKTHGRRERGQRCSLWTPRYASSRPTCTQRDDLQAKRLGHSWRQFARRNASDKL